MRRRPAFRRPSAVFACAVLIAGLAVGSLVLASRGGDAGAPSGKFKPSAAASLSSRSVLFGDTVEARLELTVPHRMAGTVFHGHPSFSPFQIVSSRVERTDLGGGLERISLVYGVACLSQKCLGREPTTNVQFGPATISIPGGRLQAVWPPLVEVSRTQDVKTPVTDGLASGPAGFPWLEPRRAIDEALVAAAASLLVLLVLRLELRRRVRRRLAAAASQASQLQILIARVEAGLPEDVLYQQRHALDALAVELRHRHIDGSLAGDAERLAWSPEYPDPGEIRSLITRIRSRVQK